MPWYELDGELWQIEQIGKQLEITSGGKTSVRTFLTPAQAELYRETQEKSERELLDLAAGGASEGKLTFAALTGHKVITGLWGTEQAEPNLDSAIEHIAEAQSTELLVVAPATADPPLPAELPP